MVQSITDILALTATGKVVLPIDVPYSWGAGKHDIPLNKVNFPLIGMTWIHEGGSPGAHDQIKYDAAKKATEAAVPSPDAEKVFMEHQFLQYFSQCKEQLSNWYLILVACTQVRELSPANLENFCKMAKAHQLPLRVLSFLAYWASSQSSLVDVEALRSKFSDNKFFEYHTTGSSTPQLCTEAIAEARGLDIFSDTEIKEVQDASDDIQDIDKARKIHPLILVKVRAIHEAAGTLPSTWYMGQKAVDRFSGKKYGALVAYLRAIFEHQMKISEISGMDLETLKQNLKDLVSSHEASSLGGGTP